METIKVLEPRVNIKTDVDKNHVVLYGGQRVNEQINVADSSQINVPPVQALWTIYPPSTQTITDRFMKVRAYIEVTTDQPHQLGTNDGVRQFPLNSIVDVTTCQINGESISDNTADKLHAMLCYGNEREDRRKSWSMTAAQPDQYQNYNDWTTLGSARNPLAEYGENSSEPSRGSIPVVVVSPTVFRVVVTEPIMLSPFYQGLGHQEEGFVNVNQFNISLRFKSDAGRVLCHSSAGAAITTSSVVFYQAPEMLTTFITPDLTEPIPALQVLPYHKAQDYIKTMAPLANGATTRVVSDSIKLSQIPRRIYLFCRRSRGTSSFLTADSFLSITGLSVLWNNQSGLFSAATSQDLFEISRRNGLNISYPAWAKYRGSVMCIELGKDIGLMDNEAPGVQGQYTVQIQMDVQNNSGATFTAEFYQVFLMEGTFSISENMGRASLGNLTPSVVLNSKESDEFHYAAYENLQGGGFFSKLKSIVNKVARGVQTVAPVAGKIAGVLAPELAPVISGIGSAAGSVRGLTGGRLAGGRLAGGKLRRR